MLVPKELIDSYKELQQSAANLEKEQNHEVIQICKHVAIIVGRHTIQSSRLISGPFEQVGYPPSQARKMIASSAQESGVITSPPLA